MRTLAAIAIVLCCACSGDVELVESPAEPSRSVTQSGPQDLAEFRRTLDAGGVPALASLDELAFFAEHAFELPPADCGERICAQPMLAVAPRFDDGNWTMAYVALNAAGGDGAPPEPRKHLLVITSGAVSATEVIDDWHNVLAPLAQRLGEGDIVSVFASGEAQLLAAALPADQLADLSFPPARGFDGEGLYAALAGALELAREPRFADYAPAVVLLTEGIPPPRGMPPAKQEVASPADFERLARRFAQQQLPITSIGLPHARYTRWIPAELSRISGGNYYVAADSAAAAEALGVEAQAVFTPLARDLQLTLRAAPGYAIGSVFAASSADVSDERVTVDSPIQFAGARPRGGFFVQLVGDEPAEETEADACQLELSYLDAGSGERARSEFTLRTPLGVGHSPQPNAPFFSDVPRAKPFMVLNTLLALRTLLRLYAADGCGGARSVRDMLGESVDYWQQNYDDDPEIAADFELVRRLASNIEAHCDQDRYKVAPADLGWFEL